VITVQYCKAGGPKASVRQNLQTKGGREEKQIAS
jgi:hypothetical protein